MDENAKLKPEEKPDEEVKPNPEEKPEDQKEQKSDEVPPGMVPYGALKQERTKRVELQMKIRSQEAKLKELESKVDSGENYDDDAKKTDPNYLTREDLVDLSLDSIAENKADAVEMIEEFDKAVEEDPQLYQQMKMAKNPARFAYDYGKRRVTEKKYGTTPEEIKSNLAKEVEEEITKKVTSDLVKKHNLKEQQPKTLGSGGSVSEDFNPDFQQPPPEKIW